MVTELATTVINVTDRHISYFTGTVGFYWAATAEISDDVGHTATEAEQLARVTCLVCRQKSEVVGWIRDDVTLGVRTDCDRAGHVTEPVDSDAQDAELA